MGTNKPKKPDKPGCVMRAPEPKKTDDGRILLDRASILNNEDRKLHELDVPEWGGVLYIRTISGKERDQLEIMMQNAVKGHNANYRATFASMIISKADGTKMFDKKDIEELSDKSGAALDRVFDFGMKVNFINEEEIQDAVKNSESARNINSGSD